MIPALQAGATQPVQVDAKADGVKAWRYKVKKSLEPDARRSGQRRGSVIDKVVNEATFRPPRA
jgi:hypothetical protein